ncbi:MAG: hypothetical protein IT245_04660 [Bacteroidia bacterium]|nr:hypothetical protein [Bacteroidia bacterium]
MKLTKESKIQYLFFILVLFSCQYKPENTLVKGHWKYEKVTENGVKIMEIGDNDILIINNDSFFYSIESVDKHMEGTWSYTNHTLHFHYNIPDTTRHFEIDLLSDKLLKMHEGDFQFEFKRIKMD